MSLEKRCVYFQGLTLTATAVEVRQTCEEIGSVEEVVLQLDGSSMFTGSAFVVFHQEEDALQATMTKLADKKHSVQFLKESQYKEMKQLLSEEYAERQFLDAYRELTPARKKLALTHLYEDRHKGHVSGGHPKPPAFVKDERISPKPVDRKEAEQPGARSHIWQEIPKISVFSGLPGKDASFGRWQYEVMCLIKENNDTSTVRSALRKSLKSPAAEVLRRLGDEVDVAHVLFKFQSLYGTVLSGEALLQKFYGEKQTAKETCAEWSCRLEDYMFEAMEQGAVSPDAITKALPSRFWSGLREERVKNALRNRELSFEELVVEARKVEEEYGIESKSEEATGAKPKIKAQQVASSTNDKLDFLIDRLVKLETQMAQLTQERKQEVVKPQQSRPVQQVTQHRPLIRCHKCGKVGHLAFGCRDGTDVSCYKCNTAGHIAASCLNVL